MICIDMYIYMLYYILYIYDIVIYICKYYSGFLWFLDVFKPVADGDKNVQAALPSVQWFFIRISRSLMDSFEAQLFESQ